MHVTRESKLNGIMSNISVISACIYYLNSYHKYGTHFVSEATKQSCITALIICNTKYTFNMSNFIKINSKMKCQPFVWLLTYIYRTADIRYRYIDGKLYSQFNKLAVRR